MGRKSSQKKKKKKQEVLDRPEGLSLQTRTGDSVTKYADRKWYWVLAIVLMFSALSYANSLRNEFVFDGVNRLSLT